MFSQLSSKFNFSAAQTPLDYRVIFVLSCLLSAWLILIDPIINRDAIIYLRIADAYLRDGFLAGHSLFDRPLLAILFALFHKLTGISLVHCGLILTTLFYGLLTTGFVATIRVLGGDRRVQILAAVVIISHPMLNGYRASIMRDPAYWAFSILAFRELLLYARAPVMRHQLRWFAFIGVATAFRFEGLFFAVLAPVAMLIAAERGRRWRLSLKLLVPPLIAVVVILGLVVIYQTLISPGEQLFPNIGSYISLFFSIPNQFAEQGGDWLEFTSRDDAVFAAIGGLAAILAINICRALTWPYVAALIWGGANRLFDRVAPRDRVLINAHLLIGLLYLALFLLTKRFMLERYSGIFTLYMLLYLPFILNAAWSKGKENWGRLIVILLLLGMSIDSVHNRDYEKSFISDATQWIIGNTPADASLVTNSSYIAYFSKRDFSWEDDKAYLFTIHDLVRKPKRWRGKDYLVVMLKRDQYSQWQDFLAQYSLVEHKVFPGERHGQISIVRIAKPQ